GDGRLAAKGAAAVQGPFPAKENEPGSSPASASRADEPDQTTPSWFSSFHFIEQFSYLAQFFRRSPASGERAQDKVFRRAAERLVHQVIHQLLLRLLLGQARPVNMGSLGLIAQEKA